MTLVCHTLQVSLIVFVLSSEPGSGNSKNHKLPVSLGSHGFATKLKQVSEEGEKAPTQKRRLDTFLARKSGGKYHQTLVALGLIRTYTVTEGSQGPRAYKPSHISSIPTYASKVF